MGSSAEPGRSIPSGISIPQWMKTKIGDRYDIEETFSPPTHDDTFFYIRYPKSTVKPVIKEPVKDPAIKLIEVENNLHAPLQDFSQHTLPCRKFISEANMSADVKELAPAKPQPPRMKPQGTDDGFSGDGAACGKSVVQVAQQMIAGKMLLRGFSVASNDNLAVPSDFDPNRRRGSRSLPASPLGTPSHSPESSPRSRRKPAFPNRYFTGAYNATEIPSGQESSSRYPGSWILSGFLGKRETTTVSHTTVIHEETVETVVAVKGPAKQQGVAQHEEKKMSDIRRNKSTPTLASADSIDDISEMKPSGSGKPPSNNQPKKGFQPKPSELREMNFWSPTSM